LAQVARAVEHEEGVLPQKRLEERVRLAGAEAVTVPGEDLPDRLGIGEEDEGGTSRAGRRARDAGKADGEAVPVRPGALLHERQRPTDPVEHLQDARDGWTGRQGRHGFLRSISGYASMMPAWTAPRPPKFSGDIQPPPTRPCIECNLPAAFPYLAGVLPRSAASVIGHPA